MFWFPVIMIIFIFVLAALFAPMPDNSHKRRRSRGYSRSRRKSKGIISMLLANQRKTERRNNSHRGVMCGPGGSKRK